MCLSMFQEHQEHQEDSLNDPLDRISAAPSKMNLPTNSLDVMLQQEANIYGSECLEILLVDNDNIADDNRHLMDWFPQMAKFCFTVVDCCELPPQSVEVAMNLLDRFLFGNHDRRSLPATVHDSSIMIPTRRQEILRSESQFQLATLTCLYIATKLSSTKCLTLAQLMRLSRHKASDFQSMELQIMFQLQFQINPPTIGSFAQHFVQEELDLWNLDASMGPGDDSYGSSSLFFHLVEQQARLATCKLYSFHVPVSSIAMACVKNALNLMEEHGMVPLSIHQKRWTSLENQVQSYYHDDQRDIALVQAQLQSQLRTAALEAMEQWSRNFKDANAVEQATWASSKCSSAGISKASSSPTTVLSSS